MILTLVVFGLIGLIGALMFAGALSDSHARNGGLSKFWWGTYPNQDVNHAFFSAMAKRRQYLIDMGMSKRDARKEVHTQTYGKDYKKYAREAREAVRGRK